MTEKQFNVFLVAGPDDESVVQKSMELQELLNAHGHRFNINGQHGKFAHFSVFVEKGLRVFKDFLQSNLIKAEVTLAEEVELS